MIPTSLPRAGRDVLPQHQSDGFPPADRFRDLLLVDLFRWCIKSTGSARWKWLRRRESVPMVLWENIPAATARWKWLRRRESVLLVLWENIPTRSPLARGLQDPESVLLVLWENIHAASARARGLGTRNRSRWFSGRTFGRDHPDMAAAGRIGIGPDRPAHHEG